MTRRLGEKGGGEVCCLLWSLRAGRCCRWTLSAVDDPPGGFEEEKEEQIDQADGWDSCQNAIIG